jgi:hypothetical protein
MSAAAAIQQRRRMRREQAAVSAAAGSSGSCSIGVTRPWYCTLQQWTTDFGAKGGLATTIRYHQIIQYILLILTSYIKCYAVACVHAVLATTKR